MSSTPNQSSLAATVSDSCSTPISAASSLARCDKSNSSSPAPVQPHETEDSSSCSNSSSSERPFTVYDLAPPAPENQFFDDDKPRALVDYFPVFTHALANANLGLGESDLVFHADPQHVATLRLSSGLVLAWSVRVRDNMDKNELMCLQDRRVLMNVFNFQGHLISSQVLDLVDEQIDLHYFFRQIQQMHLSERARYNSLRDDYLARENNGKLTESEEWLNSREASAADKQRQKEEEEEEENKKELLLLPLLDNCTNNKKNKKKPSINKKTKSSNSISNKKKKDAKQKKICPHSQKKKGKKN